MSDKRKSCDEEIIVNQLMKVQAQVDVTPIVEHGKPRTYCIDYDVEPDYSCRERGDACYNRRRESGRAPDKCSFTVTQLVCVEIPIKVRVDVDIDQGVVQCGTPRLGSCKDRKKTDCKKPDYKEIDYMEEKEELDSSSDYKIIIKEI